MEKEIHGCINVDDSGATLGDFNRDARPWDDLTIATDCSE